MKGIILAGGSGSRLYPITRSISKQMAPIAGLPMIFYPLNVLLTAGIKDILIIATPEHIGEFINLVEPILRFMGVRVYFSVQAEPGGLPEAFIIGEGFIGDDDVTLILGDNIFEDTDTITKAIGQFVSGEQIFTKVVDNPEDFGVVIELGGMITDIVEKPETGSSNLAIPGVYVCDCDVVDIAKKLSPSERGEIEIVDVHRTYLRRSQLYSTSLYTDSVWIDTGTHASYEKATATVRQHRLVENFHPGLLDAIAHGAPCSKEEFLNRLFYERES